MTHKTNDLDTPWKSILDIYFQPFIEICHPEAAKAIDWAKGYEALDKELNKISKDAETGKRIVDKLMKVWRLDGQETWVLLHIEIQNQLERHFAERMYIYHYRLFDYYRKPIVSLAVLADEHPNWQPSYYEYELWDCGLYFRFKSIKLLDYENHSQMLFNSKNPFAIAILAHLAALKTKTNKQKRFLIKLNLTRLLYEKGFNKTAILNLYSFLDYVMALPPSLELKYYNEIVKYEEENHMAYITSAERIGMQRGLQKGMEEGIQKGIQKGMQKGMQQGIKQGQKQSAQQTLLRLLQCKFNQIPAQYQTHFEQADAETLQNWCEALITANTIEEVFK